MNEPTQLIIETNGIHLHIAEQGHRLVRGSWIHQHQAFGGAPRVDVPGGIPAAAEKTAGSGFAL